MSSNTLKNRTGKKQYHWIGKNKYGQKVTGALFASNVTFVKTELRKKKIDPISIRKTHKNIFRRRKNKITQNDITLFSRQLSTLLSAGIPLAQSLETIKQGITHPSMQALIQHIKCDIESGRTLSDSLKKHPQYFNTLFCHLIDAGEQSGALKSMLENVANYKEKVESLKAKIKKALFYPSGILIIAFLVTSALLLFVVPQFESLFESFGAELPVPTQMIMKLSSLFQSYWWLVFGLIGTLMYGLRQAKQHHPEITHTIDRLLLQVPVLGNIIEKAAVARFARTLAITFSAGLPLIDALTSVAGATGHSLFTHATLQIRDEVSAGQSLQHAMRASSIFPTMAIQMVAIGEESGRLAQMLNKVADYYEEEVANAVDALSSLLEPMVMALLGIIVGGLVMTMYLPIFTLGNVV